MPRSGYVLYTNALWYRVKRLFELSGAEQTHASFNQLLFRFLEPKPRQLPRERLAQYARARARRRDLYLSFLNFSFWGEEGDTFGNILAILFGLRRRLDDPEILWLSSGRVCTNHIRYGWCASPSFNRTGYGGPTCIGTSKTSIGNITMAESGRSSAASGLPRWLPAENRHAHTSLWRNLHRQIA